MSITRVDYRERQRLSAADLRREQNYRLGLIGRHLLAAHRFGVVRGLRIIEPSPGVSTLTPGIAVDGYGRVIVVPRRSYLDVGNNVPVGYGSYKDYAFPPDGDPGRPYWFYGPDVRGTGSFPIPPAFYIPGWNPNNPF